MQAIAKRILLVDDDPLFGAVLHVEARRQGATLVHCASITELAHVRNLETFDAILIDYDLGGVKGTVVAGFINLFFGALPVAIISSTSTWWFVSKLSYPGCIVTFIHKDRPYGEIVRIARGLTLPVLLEDDCATEPAIGAAGGHPALRFARRALASVGNGVLAGVALVSPD